MGEMGDLKFTTAGDYMMKEPFKIYKAHKMLDWIENQVSDWAYELVTEHFEVETPEELTREQLDEVIAAYNDLSEYDGTLANGFYTVIRMWEELHEEELDL